MSIEELEGHRGRGREAGTRFLFLIDVGLALIATVGRLLLVVAVLAISTAAGGILGGFLVEFSNGFIGSFFRMSFEAESNEFSELLKTGNSVFGYSGLALGLWFLYNIWKPHIWPLICRGWNFVSLSFGRGRFGMVGRWARERSGGIRDEHESPGDEGGEQGARATGADPPAEAGSEEPFWSEMFERVGVGLKISTVVAALMFSLLSFIKAGETEGRSFEDLKSSVVQLEEALRKLGVQVAEIVTEIEAKKVAEDDVVDGVKDGTSRQAVRFEPLKPVDKPKTVEEAQRRFESAVEHLRLIGKHAKSQPMRLLLDVKNYEHQLRDIRKETAGKAGGFWEQAVEAIDLTRQRYAEGMKGIFDGVEADKSAEILRELRGRSAGISTSLGAIEIAIKQAFDAAPGISHEIPTFETLGRRGNEAELADVDFINARVADLEHLTWRLSQVPRPLEKSEPSTEVQIVEVPVFYEVPVPTEYPPIYLQKEVYYVSPKEPEVESGPESKPAVIRSKFTFHFLFEPARGSVDNYATGTYLSDADKERLRKIYEAVRLQGSPANKVQLQVVGFASSTDVLDENLEKMRDSDEQNLRIAMAREDAVRNELRRYQDEDRVYIRPGSTWGLGAKPAPDEVKAAFEAMEAQRDASFDDKAAFLNLSDGTMVAPSDLDPSNLRQMTRRVELRVESLGVAEPAPDSPRPTGPNLDLTSIPRAYPVAGH